ncbi:MAG: hypothetical protein A3C93_00510 [Candidatus Lloydbacteria bacterium RIFCSPHIGHO2_02_FULL_54_17]|uniref:Cohesin domain-containing protein n=1 Tax=Candidatus Lloydbacteria bacterium RIFCSPHIGHO2_02_FULL_54_17 TaxID=1798664 RepID=A0A1G2DFL2_9BACT|nr:MAG: hypothetical protein A2762_05180 [Candidatus Lloydbacteria bacterium RIFCSPHIGHO2_01_FULL_54_11]OGZ12399.1 MAG: hypothetical protein A3C93_00510 [Candidatus Lloydbacteria bacterium RIFCSPHIGHO2_02_FULL_54_17]
MKHFTVHITKDNPLLWGQGNTRSDLGDTDLRSDLVFPVRLLQSVLLGLLLFFPLNLFAAEVSFIATPPVAAVGQEVGVDIVLDTEGRTATALSGEITITGTDGKPVTVVRIQDGGSVIGAWLKEATTNTPGKVGFSGIIPGGRRVSNEHVLTLYFVPEKTGTLTFVFSGEVFFTTAPGEPVSLPRVSFALLVNETPQEDTPPLPQDETPPSDIRAIIAQNEAMFDGRPFIIVHAKDAESGILMYELLEIGEYRPLAGLENDTLLPWRRIENPEALLYPVNTRYIYVRVTDREGNSAVAFVGAPELSPEKTAIWFNKWLILAILIGVAGLLSLWLWVRRGS